MRPLIIWLYRLHKWADKLCLSLHQYLSCLYCPFFHSPSVLCLSLLLCVFTLSSLPSFSSEKLFCYLQLLHLAEILMGISGNFLDRSWVEFPKSINLVLMLYKQWAWQTLNIMRQPQNIVPSCRFLLPHMTESAWTSQSHSKKWPWA